MTEVLNSPPSSSSSSLPTQTQNDTLFQPQSLVEEEQEQEQEEEEVKERDNKDSFQLSLLAFLVALFRKSFWVTTCKTGTEELCAMDIGCPTDVRHVAHVTFDRFNGFLGLPLEFEPEVLRRAPSASATVFGVSTESMQLSYDHRGNSVPTILLLMQHHLYAQGGLQAEGIFRITAGNSQEEYVRNQLNRGMVPEGIDVHSLAGLIKAWFRELPNGVLDPLSAEQVMQSQTEEECSALVRLLPPTETALLEWAINLMADVVQQEHVNKMNICNIAMVFAPNMTQMAEPLTALMYAVQVMNFLKTLISKTLREREDIEIETAPVSHLEPSDENGPQDPSQPCLEVSVEECEKTDEAFVAEEPELESLSESSRLDSMADEEYFNYSASEEEFNEVGWSGETEASVNDGPNDAQVGENTHRSKVIEHQIVVRAMGPVDKSMGVSNLSLINSRTEWIEAWR